MKVPFLGFLIDKGFPMVRVFTFQVVPVRRPGWFVNQNPEVFWRTAPDRDSGSELPRFHRGESVNQFL